MKASRYCSRTYPARLVDHAVLLRAGQYGAGTSHRKGPLSTNEAVKCGCTCSVMARICSSGLAKSARQGGYLALFIVAYTMMLSR